MTYGATAWPNHRHNDLPESKFIGGSFMSRVMPHDRGQRQSHVIRLSA